MTRTHVDARRTVLAVVLAGIVVLSMVAAGATATAAGDAAAPPALESTASTPADGELAGGASDTVDPGDATNGTILGNLTNASGTVDVVVRFGDTGQAPVSATGASAVDAMEQRARAAQEPLVSFASERDGIEVVNRFWLANAVLLEVDLDAVGERGLRSVAAVEGVRTVHPNFEVSVPGEETARATDGASGTANADYNTTYGLDQVNATEVWDEYGTMGGGAKVAVLDTGVSVDHPDIDLYTEDPSDPTYPGGWAEFDVDGDRVEDSEPHDTDYHGTHTSGTVAGGNASGEYIGVAPNASLMHGLVIPGGSGSFAQIIAGMEWAVEENADAISMSLGANGYNEQMIEPVRNAYSAGTVVVAATGNVQFGSGAGQSASPGNVYEAFGVGASNESAGIAQFSMGEVIDTDRAWLGAQPDDWPEEYVVPNVAAPGVDVKSAVPEGFFDDDPDAKYGYASGTSMATPHVAGALALAISASEDDPGVDDLTSAFESTAWKPADCQPYCDADGRDNRYGTGIIDAPAATDLLAADTGVNGTVTGPDGSPIEDARVEFANGFGVSTDADGSYVLRESPGTYDVTADAFGYEAATEPVTVTAGNVTTQDFSLAERLAVETASGQPDGVQAGDDVSVTLRVAHADTLSVTATGSYDASAATLRVDGTEYDFGEPVDLDGDVGTVDVTVTTATGEAGELGLEYAASGLGDTVTHETGPTVVYDEPTEVAVVDTPGGVWGGDTQSALNRTLPANYRTTLVNSTDLLSVTDEYDAFVVQNMSMNEPGLMRSFVEATDDPDTGVVFLDQWGPGSEAINARWAGVGDPVDTHQDPFGFAAPNFTVTADHPIFDGVASEGETVTVHTGAFADRTWFEGFTGRTVATVGDSDVGTLGSAIGVKPMTRTVLAGSLGRTPLVTNADYTADADRILANAVEYASAAPAAGVVEEPADQSGVGDPITTTLDVENLTQVRVSVDEESTLSADDLSLYVDGSVNAFGEWRAYDPAVTDENFTVTVVPDEGAVGSVALDVTAVADGDTVHGDVGPTGVYDPPLTVPGDVDTLQEAVDLAPVGADVALADGTHVQRADVRTPAITIRSAGGANATLAAPADSDSALYVHAVGVTVGNVTIDASGTTGVLYDDARLGTVRDARIENASNAVLTEGGDFLAWGSNHLLVEDATVTGTEVGVSTDSLTRPVTVRNSTFRDVGAGVALASERAVVEGNVVENSTGGLQVAGSGSTVAENTVNNSSTGIYVGTLASGVLVENNTVHTADFGIAVDWYAATEGVRNNVVRNASDGIWLGPAFEPHPIVGNDVTGDVGLRVEQGYADFAVRYNDFAGADVGIENVGTRDLDALLNYFGPRGPADATGPVTADPFLTAPPEDAAPGDAPITETTAIGTDLSMDANGTYTVGVPGPSDQTVGDAFGNFTGAVYGWSADSQSWELATGNDSLAALDALAVVAEEDARAVLHFQSDGPGTPGQTTVQEGWNYVAAPEYAGADAAFEHSTADLGLALGMFESPSSQLGPESELEGTYAFGPGDAPTVSPFEGAFVFAEDDGTLPAYLHANPTAGELFDALGLETPTLGVPDGTSAAADEPESLAELANETATRVAATTDDRDAVRRTVRLTVLRAMHTGDFDALTRAELEALVDDAVDQALDTQPGAPGLPSVRGPATVTG